MLQPVDFDPFAEPAGETFPLSEQQREMRAVTLMGDDANCAYNQCFALRLRGPLSEQSLRNALRQVVERHEALRLRIDGDAEEQEVLAGVEIALPLVDLSEADATQRETAISELLDRETRTAFDLTVAPLWRAQLIREAPDLHRLIFTAHHIVADGWSSAVIFGDLGRAYVADRFGLAAQLPQAASYRDFVANERTTAAMAEAHAAEDYWVAQFARGVPSFELPFDRPRPPLKTYNAARQVLAIDKVLYQAVRKMGAQQGATLFVTLLAAFEILIARLSSSEELVVGVPMASQALQDNGHLVAHGVNTIPLLCHVDMQHSFTEHLHSARRTFLDAQAHQRLTFGSLVHRLRLPRDPSRTPLVTVIFNIDKLGAPFDFGAARVEGIDAPKAFYNFEFGINAVDDGESLLLECDYNSDLLNAETVSRWLGHYRELLIAVAANPAMRVSELPLLTPTEREQLVGSSSAARQYAPGPTLHERFEQQVARSPQAIALSGFTADEARFEMSY
ncbi:MAG TPA: condensation domain-containing protein, partial [Steroidobacteraceae bacterium]